MFEFERPNIEVVEISEDKKYGRFVVEPLERGYGITLGNSLRRIMLSSLPGVAVSQVKIEGVLHEFSSIPGVKEDVTEIIMNVKSLAIRSNSDANEVKTAYIEYEGEGVVRASDIQVDQETEYGRTVYIEERPDSDNMEHRLYSPEGKLLASLSKEIFCIGKKKEEVDLVLEDISVSRMHARIMKQGTEIYLEDLNSTNGTYKNGLRLEPYERRKLESEDEIKCGNIILIFR